MKDLQFRQRLVALSDEAYFRRSAGKINMELVGLWELAVSAAREEGLSLETAIKLFMEGYDSYCPSAAPWAVLTAESISGISDERVGAEWMLRVAGTVFAAYGVTPRFGVR